MTVGANTKLECTSDCGNAYWDVMQTVTGKLSMMITGNEIALKQTTRLLGSYEDANGVKFWIITEADRRCTTILLPEEY